MGYRRPLLCAPDDHSLSLAKSPARRTALRRTKYSLRSQHEMLQGPLVAAIHLHMNSPIIGTLNERSTVLKYTYIGASKFIFLYIRVSWLSYPGYGSDIIARFLSDRIDIISPLLLIMHLGYASPARI